MIFFNRRILLNRYYVSIFYVLFLYISRVQVILKEDGDWIVLIFIANTLSLNGATTFFSNKKLFRPLGD